MIEPKIILIFSSLFMANILFGQDSYQQEKQIKLAEESPFEKIIKRELPAQIEYEDDEIIAFAPLRPQAPVHLLLVPKKRISTMNDILEEDVELVGKMALTAKLLAERYGIAESGYRLVLNTNEDSGQSVFHIHMHLLGGIKLGPMVDQAYRNESGN